MRDAVRNPKTELVITLDRVLPAVLVLQSHTEDADNSFVAHRGAVFLTVLPVCPWRHQAGPALAVGEAARRRKFPRTVFISSSLKAPPPALAM